LLPPVDNSERVSEAVPPGTVAAEESDKEFDWQKAAAPDRRTKKNRAAGGKV
jgi:hypothetical protein